MNIKIDINTENRDLNVGFEHANGGISWIMVPEPEVSEFIGGLRKLAVTLESEYVYRSFLESAHSVTYFCNKYLNVENWNPAVGSWENVNLIPYDYQKRYLRFLEENNFVIATKFRQGGFTTMTLAWALWKAMFSQGERILFFTKQDREAIAAASTVRNMIEKLPNHLKLEMVKNNDHTQQFANGNVIEYMPASAMGKGKRISILIIDEPAFIPDMDKHWKALYPCLSKGAKCIAVGTPNGKGNWFHHTYLNSILGPPISEPPETQKGVIGFKAFQCSYKEHPIYQDENWAGQTKANLGEKFWQQEVEGLFL